MVRARLRAARVAPKTNPWEPPTIARWSMWYYGEGSPVPLVRGAEIVTWVGDRPLTLAELEDSTVGNRRPPGGDAVVVRGRAAGVWVEAELLAAGGASTPQASVTVT